MKEKSIKNLKDILKENLRLLDEEKKVRLIEDKNFQYDAISVSEELPSSKPSYHRLPVSEEELDVTQLELKSYSASKKILRRSRKALHKEIRDWIVFPLQQKQTKFNLKTIQNITEIFSEIDYGSERIDTNVRNIQAIQAALNSLMDGINQKMQATQAALNSSMDGINQKIDTINSKIEKEILLSRKNFEIEPSIKKSFTSILEREPNEEEIRYYFNLIQSGQIELEDLEKVLRKSDEYRNLDEGNEILKKILLLIKKPIFIIGVPRTGTTLLHSILCAHDQLAWFSHQDIKNWISDLEHHQIYDYYNWLKSTKKKIPMTEEALLVFGKRLGSGLKQFGHPPKGTTKIPIEGEIFWRKYFGSEYVRNIPLDKKILLAKDLLETIKKQSKPRFVCKAPQNSMRLFAIKKIFSDAKFINVSRDPRAVVNSMLQRNKEEGKWKPNIQIKNKTSYASLDLVGKFSTLYKEVTESISEFMIKNPDNFITVEYEDLISDPVKVVNKVIKFCELDERNPKKLMPPIRKNTIEKWKKNLTKEDQKRIFEVTEPDLQKMNYTYHIPTKIKKPTTITSKIYKPIFIIGVPRSGTTFLYYRLCNHPDLAWLSHRDVKFWISEKEQKKMKETIMIMKKNNQYIPHTDISQFILGTEFQPGLKGTSKIPIEGETLWKQFFDDYDRKISIDKKNQLIKIIEEIVENQKKPRFMNKAPQNSVRLFDIQKCFPDAKFINLARDPKAVISSMIVKDNLEGGFDPGISIKNKAKYEKLNSIQKWAWLYKEITDAIHEFSLLQSKENFLTVRYEELIEHPYENLRKIQSFCELKPSPLIDENVPPKRPYQTTKWKDTLTSEDVRQIFDIVTSSLEKMNYQYKL